MTNRQLKLWDLRYGAYDGAHRRRFVIFESKGNGLEWRHEFDTRREAMAKATLLVHQKQITDRAYQERGR